MLYPSLNLTLRQLGQLGTPVSKPSILDFDCPTAVGFLLGTNPHVQPSKSSVPLVCRTKPVSRGKTETMRSQSNTKEKQNKRKQNKKLQTEVSTEHTN